MTRRMAVLAALTVAPLVADAQSYRCIGTDGKRYYGSTIPAECYAQPVEQLNAQGMVVKRVDPEGSEKERLAKEAADARKRDEESVAREQARRNRALLATYTSEQDIEDARARALAENTKATSDVDEPHRVGAQVPVGIPEGAGILQGQERGAGACQAA